MNDYRDRFRDLEEISSEAVSEINNHRSGRPDCYLATFFLAKILDYYSERDPSKNSNYFPYGRIDVVAQRQFSYRLTSPEQIRKVLKKISRRLLEVELASPSELYDLAALCLDLEQVFRDKVPRIIDSLKPVL